MLMLKGLRQALLPGIRFASTALEPNYYQVLELSRNASIKDIKAQFRKLSKKYHPDLNSHLSEEEREENNKKYVLMLLAYDTLKDVKAKREYDASLGLRKNQQSHSNPNHSDWQNKYYGEAKYYSKGRASGSYFSKGYSSKRHRVHNFYDGSGGESTQSTFNGSHKNYGDRYSVPHFNYNEHLAKHLKFEQRIIEKLLTPEVRDAIIRQLKRDGDISNVSEELITKHLMRQAHGNTNLDKTVSPNTSNPYMYQGPQNGGYHEELNFGKTAAIVIGGLGSIYLLYNAIA